MSKKFFIIISIVLIIFIFTLGGYYFIIQTNTPGVKTTPSSIFKNFIPFGGGLSVPTPSPSSYINTATEPATFANIDLKLRKIFSDSVSGFGIGENASGTIIRHMDTATGHVYETDLFSPRQDRITNITIPTVYNTFWGSDLNNLVTQYLDADNQTIHTYSATLTDEHAHSTSTGDMLSGYKPSYSISVTTFPEQVDSIALLHTNLFFLSKSQYHSAGFVANVHLTKTKQIWNSPIRELIPQFVNDTTVAVTTKPYQNVSGYLYFINTVTGTVQRVLGDILGLSTLVSPDAKKILTLTQGRDGAFLSLFTTIDKSSLIVTPTTFPEKCVWSKVDLNVVYCAVPHEKLEDNSLTDWYMGKLQYTDDIWKYDLTSNTSHLIENLSSDSSEQIDVTKIALSPNEKYIVFINKRDGSLWSLNITK